MAWWELENHGAKINMFSDGDEAAAAAAAAQQWDRTGRWKYCCQRCVTKLKVSHYIRDRISSRTQIRRRLLTNSIAPAHQSLYPLAPDRSRDGQGTKREYDTVWLGVWYSAVVMNSDTTMSHCIHLLFQRHSFFCPANSQH